MVERRTFVVRIQIREDHQRSKLSCDYDPALINQQCEHEEDECIYGEGETRGSCARTSP
jgi:hypothetical protein